MSISEVAGTVLEYAAKGWPMLPLRTAVGTVQLGKSDCGGPCRHPLTPSVLCKALTPFGGLEIVATMALDVNRTFHRTRK